MPERQIMTNPLIPYSFEPGTKAKAQEVNANFISVAEEINNNKTFFDGKVTELISSTDTLKTSIDETNDEVATKMGYKNVTNCIIESPNGVAEYNGNILTVKAGLKVLIPDGFNTDGTIKNIEYALEEDVSIDLTGKTDELCYIFINSDGEIITSPLFGYFESDGDPINYTTKATNYCWLDTINNKYKFSINSGTNWNLKSCCKIGLYKYEKGNFTLFETNEPVQLLRKDCFENYVLALMPDYTKGVRKTSSATYYAEENGWLKINSQHNGCSAYANLAIGTEGLYQMNQNIPAYSWNENYMIPVPKGSSYTVVIGEGTHYFKFYPCKGGL